MASWLGATGALGAATNTVLTVNRNAVTPEEFVFFAQQERSGALAASGRKPFWNPWRSEAGYGRLLRQKTIARVTRETVRRQLFQGLGLVQSADFADVVKLLERTNREREQAAKQGRVVYGPVRFGLAPFYEDWTAKLELQAKEKLAAGRLAVSPADARKFYETNRRAYKTPEFSDWELLTVENDSTNAAARKAFDKLCRKIPAEMRRAIDSETVVRNLAAEPGARVTLERQPHLDDGRLGEWCGDERTVNKLERLGSGDCVEIRISPEKIRIYRRASHTAAAVRPFEAVALTVRNRLLDEKYAAFLEALCQRAEVKIDGAALDAITLP